MANDLPNITDLVKTTDDHIGGFAIAITIMAAIGLTALIVNYITGYNFITTDWFESLFLWFLSTLITGVLLLIPVSMVLAIGIGFDEGAGTIIGRLFCCGLVMWAMIWGPHAGEYFSRWWALYPVFLWAFIEIRIK